MAKLVKIYVTKRQAVLAEQALIRLYPKLHESERDDVDRLIDLMSFVQTKGKAS